jgi:hypothetical protein
VRRHVSGVADNQPGGVTAFGPDRDDAVLPGDVLLWWTRLRLGLWQVGRHTNLGVARRQLERGVASSDHLDGLDPLVGASVQGRRRVGFDRIAAGTEPDFRGALGRRHDASGSDAWRVIADQQRVPRDRHRALFGIDDRDLDAKKARSLRGFAGHRGKRQRREHHHPEHGPMLAVNTPAVNAAPGVIDVHTAPISGRLQPARLPSYT